MDRLASEFVRISEQGDKTDPGYGSTLLLSFRGDWEPAGFKALRATAPKSQHS